MDVNFPYKLYQQRHRMETQGSYTNWRTQRKLMQKAAGTSRHASHSREKQAGENMTIEK